MPSKSSFIVIAFLSSLVNADVISTIQENIFPPKVTRDDISLTYYSRNYNGTYLRDENLHIVNANWPTVLLIHGWTRDGNESFYGKATEALLFRRDYNIISVDWAKIADLWYTTSVYLLEDVGRIIADFLVDLQVKSQLSFEKTELVGHSLGAQVCGYIGRIVYNKTGSKLERILGLDPAGPFFQDFVLSTENVGTGDAKLVITIHTDQGFYGSSKVDSDIAFFPNGGTPPQPGCDTPLKKNQCSHGRAHEIYVESVRNPFAFKSTNCTNYFDYNLGLCQGNKEVYIGGKLEKEDIGRYYLKTKAEYPFSLQ